jgi:transcription-repair coupling factor (superfamily II helicase)
MSLEPLIRLIADSSRELIQTLQTGESLGNLGLRRAARLPLMAGLYGQLQRPILLLTDRADRAIALADELGQWAPQAQRMIFPEPAPLFYENASWGETTRRERLNALTALAAYLIPGARAPEKPPLIIAPARALMTRTLPRREFLKATRNLRQGQQVSMDELARQLIGLGYEPATIVVAPGQFARRGGILDLWPPAEILPVRLEFFGDEIDTLRRFEANTQRSARPPKDGEERVLVTPAREFLLNAQQLQPALAIGGEISAQEPLLEEINEFYLPLLHPSPASLLDYLPRQALVAIDNLQALLDSTSEIEEQAVRLRQDMLQEGTLPDDFPIPYLTGSELQDALASHTVVQLGPTSSVDDEVGLSFAAPTLAGLAERFQPGPRYGGRLKLLMDDMARHYQAGESVVVVSRQKARLKELWAETAQLLENGRQHPQFLEGSLSEGWIFHPPGQNEKPIHLLTDGEIFGWRRPEPRRRPRALAEAPEAAYSDLQVGDYVVHVDHGIGRFAGLVHRTVEGLAREYLAVEYADEAQLFVPVYQADRLTRYVGPDGRSPELSRLGSQEWRSVKTHVKEAVQEVAEDLLNLYAARSVVQGHAFSPDTVWQQELEASFPYIETDDQVQVLEQVKQDMEASRPMDRLICGDVGYGKTEVALRAAFKAVMDGKQVALLVPTTVLAQQHYHTFLQRLSAFPVEVEMLSRFRTPQQQKDILERLEQGGVDILIGTHRLLSSDVQFKDLGLLIIDEEQRFGVTHKEKLKRLRTEVDVLTLTATPIPRTLYMALSGVRDISTINTPPEERLPVVTHVGPYSKRLVRQAILRELERGGQVFFVHNRVQTIGAMRSHLQQLVPEARLTVAHGQMVENELSERMEQFSRGDVDVLLSTSIIESGLDIPNANTLIVDRADTFGLAQLYQLRGRVGRGAQRAYAYFFRHNRKAPTPEGRQRLETIAENTQLGAGFSIAMRDLEIRGTGDILGTRQHGNIAAVGFHLYTRLLAAAVQRLRGGNKLPAGSILREASPQAASANVDLPLPASLPADYVPDKEARLGLYRRLANLQTQSELDALGEEFQDRFGPPPEAVRNLLFQLKIKLLADQAGLASISAENGQFSLRFPSEEPPYQLPDLSLAVRVGKTALWIAYNSLPDWQATLEKVLGQLSAARARSAG